jgi:ppGpp synthetase/RelA/SpoT-type nucleotidyltranferase
VAASLGEERDVPARFHDEYTRAVAPLGQFGEALKTLLERLLAAESGGVGPGIHAVTYRVKSEESAESKTARPRQGAAEAGPRSMADLHDLLGIRIITYFRDGVDDAARLIEREFAILPDESVDKRAALDPDRFGYLSVHYVAELNPVRATMPEYKEYAGIRFEVQIRSILQHAWAEIEHDLGYKSKEAVPRLVRRRFSRLASFLELADDEFVAIRQEIGGHQATARAKIKEGGLGMDIDQDSLSAFVQSNQQVREFDQLIAKHRHVATSKRLDAQFLGRRAGDLKELGFRVVQDVSTYLDDNRELLGRFVENWLKLTAEGPSRGRAPVPVPVGITLYYLGALRYAQALASGAEPGTEYARNDQALLRRALSVAS